MGPTACCQLARFQPDQLGGFVGSSSNGSSSPTGRPAVAAARPTGSAPVMPVTTPAPGPEPGMNRCRPQICAATCSGVGPPGRGLPLSRHGWSSRITTVSASRRSSSGGPRRKLTTCRPSWPPGSQVIRNRGVSSLCRRSVSSLAVTAAASAGLAAASADRSAASADLIDPRPKPQRPASTCARRAIRRRLRRPR
jgi:hypothetical protein